MASIANPYHIEITLKNNFRPFGMIFASQQESNARGPSVWCTMTNTFQHYLNPLHVYCRLRDLRVPKALPFFSVSSTNRRSLVIFRATRGRGAIRGAPRLWRKERIKKSRRTEQMASRRFVNNMLSVFDLEIAETLNSSRGITARVIFEYNRRTGLRSFRILSPGIPPHHRIEAYRVVGEKR